MTITDFTRDIVPILQLLVTSLGLLSLALLWWQMRRSTMWNKLQSHLDFFRDKPSASAEKRLFGCLDRLNLDRYAPLTKEQAVEVFDDSATCFAAKVWLNEFEDLCAAVNAGTVDAEYAYALESERVVRNYRLFEQLISRVRDVVDSPAIFVELETTALAWERKQLQFHGKRQAKVATLKSALESAKKASGVNKKY